MKKFIKSLSIFLIPLSFSCSTIIDGTQDNIYFTDSYQSSIVVNDIHTCLSPCSLKIKKSQTPLKIKIIRDKIITDEIVINKRFNKNTLFNLLYLVGWIVDGLTGAMFEIVNDQELNKNKFTINQFK